LRFLPASLIVIGGFLGLKGDREGRSVADQVSASTVGASASVRVTPTVTLVP